jgi:hypothetical protein
MTNALSVWRVASLTAVAFAMASCASSTGKERDAGDGSYLAFASNFAGYEDWDHAASIGAEGAPVGVHDLGPMTVYWNQLPPAGASEFEVGTIIVKQTDPSAVALQVFAMVKRGGGYNSGGARDWEFFELLPAAVAAPVILWRGVGPPDGESYGGDPNTCNTCHSQAAAHDYVWSTVLQQSLDQ